MEDNSLLPHDVWKSARKSLVKLSVSDGETHVTRRKTLLNSFHKDEVKFKQFKSSIILLNSMNRHKSRTDCSVLPSVIKLKRQRIIRLPSQDDLWKSIKSNYFYLMDNNLVDECQKTNKELSLHSPPSSPVPFTHQPISFPEFVERFNALHDRLHQLLLFLQDDTKQHNFIELQSEMDLLGCENEFLCDQATILQRLDPELKDDVGRRCTILKNKWDVLTNAMWPKKKQEKDFTTKSLTTDVRTFRKWLREVEERLRRMKVTDMTSADEIRNLYNEEKVLQREIEERGKEINSLVRRCQPATDGAADGKNPTRLSRYARHLERSWHHIWIRSLENQCHTEQYLKRHSAVLAQNVKESSDTDEGPLRKHRRLNLDPWTALAATMDRLKTDHSKRTGDILKNSIVGQRKRDVGVLCSEKVPVNDKCIMVGTTGIAALKAEYGDDFTNFEIIQDVGYSSESSTHLSSDDTGLESHFNVRIYKYTKDNQPTPLSLREELESAVCLREFNRLGSSLESSSSAGVSLDDSGLGTGETLTNGDSGDILSEFPVDDEYEQDDLDYLETVLDEVDFGASGTSDQEELHFNLSGLESDDSSDNFHNRSSFTTSAQVFYKMISVDSDNGEPEPNDSNNNVSLLTTTEHSFDSPISNSNDSSNDISYTDDQMNKDTKSLSSDSDPETFKLVHGLSNSSEKTVDIPRSHPVYCSTPIRSCDKSYKYQNLKRKRDCENAGMSNRVHSWLSHSVSQQNVDTESQSSPGLAQSFLTEDVSSCDASCEGTSSSSDEGNAYSSMSSSLCEDEVFRLKPRINSTVGSIDTVVQSSLDSELPILLPPPPSSTESTEIFSKNCGSVYYRMKRCSRRMKSLSDNDVDKKQSLKKTPNLSAHYILQNRCLSKTTAGSKHRLYSSLPTFLRPTSESSTDDYYLSSTLPSHSDTKTSVCTNHSSLSELRKRRRRRSRKKSSSSNRSSTRDLLSSGERSRHRSRTVTSSTSRCGSRRRTVSQRSEFFCTDMPSDDAKSLLKVDIPPVEENVGFNKLRRPSSGLLSPVESDIVLTQLEEQSTVSDQVWDGYQEMPYLSEGYSEATVDEDAVRKLTEFGDDYGSAIGQPLRLLEPPDDNNKKADCLKSQKKFSKPAPAVSSVSDDSDSDSEDLHYVIEESGKALHFARAILKRREAGESLSSADYAELLATCGTHLRCLETIRSHIDGKEQNFSISDLKQLHYLIDEWLVLQRHTDMFEKSEDPVRQKYVKAQHNIDALFDKMSQLSSYSDLDTRNLTSWEDVDKKLSRLHMVLTSLQEAKEQLLTVNLQVHRFNTEHGDDENYKNCSLKNDITELYRQWEDAYEQNGANLTELELLKSDWELYNEKYRRLRHRVKEAELKEDCDNDRLISATIDSDSLREDLEDLKESSKLLESRLKGGDAWTKIEEDLKDLQRRIYRHQKSLIRTASPSVNHRSPSSRIEEDADDHFEDAIQQLCEEKDHSIISTPQKKSNKAATVAPKRSSSRFWRILKVAVPVQVALVLLYCLACYLEPSCCNSLNNFNFSFTPQLRYFGGRPPV